jgi:hypothetical protein
LQRKSREKKSEIESAKKKAKECVDCRKNCIKHEKLKEEHENASCCDKKKVEIEKWKEKITKAKEKGVKNETIKKYEKEYRELRQLSLKNRVTCPKFQAINQEIRGCSDCQKQKAKKAVKIIPTPVKKVLLVNTEVKPEIYLLAEDAVCWYNKKDLAVFLQDEKKKRLQFYKEQKSITDLSFYGIARI